MSPLVLLRLLKETIQAWQADKASRLAAAVAYYTIFSLAPLLIIAVAIAGAIFGAEAAQGEIVGQIQDLVGKEGATVIETAIKNAHQPEISSFASLISVGVLLFGASGVFAELQDALNTVWNVKAKPNQGIIYFLRKRILSFCAVLGIGFLLLFSLIISAILSALSKYIPDLFFGAGLFWQILNQVVSLGLISCSFALMFKLLPDVKIKWRDVWVGAIITAILFTIGKFSLGLYLARSSFSSTYGAAGSLVIILAWVYYSAQIIFLGAEFTQVYSKRYGSPIIPDKHAVSVADLERTRTRMERKKRN